MKHPVEIEGLLNEAAKETDQEDIANLTVDNIKGVGEKTLSALGNITIRELSILELDMETMKRLRVKPNVLKTLIAKAKLLTAYADGVDLDPGRIVFAGLDKAGKTSFILSLQGRYEQELKEKGKIAPTLDAIPQKLKIGGKKVIVWDFGGQVALRKQYLSNPRHFRHIILLFYLIDIQDHRRFGTSLEYLQEILQLLKVQGENPSLVIVFHKKDPELKVEETELANREQSLKTDIKNMAQSFNFSFYSTSIMDRPTIISAFSSALMSISHVEEPINAILEDIALQQEATVIALASQTGVRLGKWSNLSWSEYYAFEAAYLTELAKLLFTSSEATKSRSFQDRNRLPGLILELAFDSPIYLILGKGKALSSEETQALTQELGIWVQNLLTGTLNL
ncbi:MAG: ADP-ribosylation factor-like protein [Promethearchaeota archaeon]